MENIPKVGSLQQQEGKSHQDAADTQNVQQEPQVSRQPYNGHLDNIALISGILAFLLTSIMLVPGIILGPIAIAAAKNYYNLTGYKSMKIIVAQILGWMSAVYSLLGTLLYWSWTS